MENGKDQSHETQAPALNGECYLYASTRTETIVRAATWQKTERFRTNFSVFDNREKKNRFGAFRVV